MTEQPIEPIEAEPIEDTPKPKKAAKAKAKPATATEKARAVVLERLKAR